MSKLAHAASVACCKQLEPWCSRHGYTVDVCKTELGTPGTGQDKVEYVVTVRGYLNGWSFNAIILHFASKGASTNWILDHFAIPYSKPSFFEDIEDIVHKLSRTPDDVIDEFIR